MKKRFLFLEDLYNYYINSHNQSVHFDSAESDSTIVVQVPGKIKFDDSDKNAEGLMPVHLRACHTGLNHNQSFIADETMESNLDSFKNRPILGYIHTVDDEPQFYTHNMYVDDNGEVVYQEFPVGIIPESCNVKLVKDEESGKKYCEVDGYIFEEYSKAAEILSREQECSVSVELSVRSLSYNAAEKYLEIEDFFFSGVTILGVNPKGDAVNPGMEGSNITLADFSQKNNSMFADYENKIDELQARISQLESACFNKNSKEGGTEDMTLFEKLLEKYGKKIEDITFEYDGLSDEELESKFAEVFEDESSDPESNPSGDDDGDDDDSDNGDDSGDEGSVQFEKMVRTYELSHDDIRYALYQLLSSVETADDEYYYISSVYDDHFIYRGWCSSNKIYGQKYVKDGDNVSFDGERYALHEELLTDSEYAELQSMRSNYATLVKYKEDAEKNELHYQKETIISDEKYAALAEKDESGKYVNADFEKLVEEMDNYSLADFETSVKVMHSDFISSHSNFASVKPDTKNKNIRILAGLNGKSKPKKRYGNLFDDDEK